MDAVIYEPSSGKEITCQCGARYFIRWRIPHGGLVAGSFEYKCELCGEVFPREKLPASKIQFELLDPGKNTTSDRNESK